MFCAAPLPVKNSTTNAVLLLCHTGRRRRHLPRVTPQATVRHCTRHRKHLPCLSHPRPCQRPAAPHDLPDNKSSCRGDANATVTASNQHRPHGTHVLRFRCDPVLGSCRTVPSQQGSSRPRLHACRHTCNSPGPACNRACPRLSRSRQQRGAAGGGGAQVVHSRCLEMSEHRHSTPARSPPTSAKTK